ncbi:hypothetical protein LINPERPRIM_LOCUS13338 [Linum perenne]
MKSWNYEVFKRLEVQIAEKLSVIEALDLLEDIGRISDSDIIQRIQLKCQLDHLWKKEEISWAQKAKENWLQLGDHNTRFFHRVANAKRRFNSIDRINVNGSEVYDQCRVNIPLRAQLRGGALAEWYKLLLFLATISRATFTEGPPFLCWSPQTDRRFSVSSLRRILTLLNSIPYKVVPIPSTSPPSSPSPLHPLSSPARPTSPAATDLSLSSSSPSYSSALVDQYSIIFSTLLVVTEPVDLFIEAKGGDRVTEIRGRSDDAVAGGTGEPAKRIQMRARELWIR